MCLPVKSGILMSFDIKRPPESEGFQNQHRQNQNLNGKMKCRDKIFFSESD